MKRLGFLPLCTPLLCAAALTLCWSPMAWAQEEAEVTAEADVAVEEAAVAEVEAEEAEDSVTALRDDTNTLWTCLAAFIVFFMQAGFMCVESGFTRAKSACNIVMKNLMDFSIGSLAFWLIGFGLMFGASGTAAGWIGTSMFMFSPPEDAPFDWAFLIFQTVFAATAATIVSGAMAERTKYVGYLAYSAAITVLVYPVFGKWAWGSLLRGDESAGWLENKGFLDFAGSTVVHSVGAWAALAGAIVIGPRIGKYVNGKSMPIPGHNIPLAALGVFILWLGWFGFNPGSTTAVDGGSFARIAVVTNICAASGAIGAMFASWILFRKPDPSFALNGALAGLVTITAGCDIMPIPATILMGMIGGVLVVFSCVLLDRFRVDDPVGAVSVHGTCGVWGTLCIGIFGPAASASQFGIQALGVAAAFLWAFPVSLVIFLLIKYTIGLRVTEQEEIDGVDVSEHGLSAYPRPFLVEDSLGVPPTPTGMAAGATSSAPVTHGA